MAAHSTRARRAVAALAAIAFAKCAVAAAIPSSNFTTLISPLKARDDLDTPINLGPGEQSVDGFSLSQTALNLGISLGVPESFPDPDVYYEDNDFYAFATTYGVNVQVARSSNFRDWGLDYNFDALPYPGRWSALQSPGVWAPSVFKNNQGRYVLTYSARPRWNYYQHCIGVAIGIKPSGPFWPMSEAFACPIDKGGALDSANFRDPNTNKLYILYKVDGNNVGRGGLCNNMVEPQAPTPIILQEVADDGMTKVGPPVEIFDRAAQDGPLVEAPSLAYDEVSDRYLLFYSSGCYLDSSYDIAYVFSEGNDIRGPYTRLNPDSKFVNDGGKPSQRLITSNTPVPGGRDNGGFAGPGGPGVVRGSDGSWGLVFHSYTDASGRRSMLTARLEVDGRRGVDSVKLLAPPY